MIWFQFTLPCRERPREAVAYRQRQLFQFTLPCRERRLDALSSASGLMFQFTLPCRERPSGALRVSDFVGVSIHAPV